MPSLNFIWQAWVPEYFPVEQLYCSSMSKGLLVEQPAKQHPNDNAHNDNAHLVPILYQIASMAIPENNIALSIAIAVLAISDALNIPRAWR